MHFVLIKKLMWMLCFDLQSKSKPGFYPKRLLKNVRKLVFVLQMNIFVLQIFVFVYFFDSRFGWSRCLRILNFISRHPGWFALI